MKKKVKIQIKANWIRCSSDKKYLALATSLGLIVFKLKSEEIVDF